MRFNYASEHFAAHLPIVYVQTVVGLNKKGELQTYGLFISDLTITNNALTGVRETSRKKDSKKPKSFTLVFVQSELLLNIDFT